MLLRLSLIDVSSSFSSSTSRRMHAAHSRARATSFGSMHWAGKYEAYLAGPMLLVDMPSISLIVALKEMIAGSPAAEGEEWS